MGFAGVYIISSFYDVWNGFCFWMLSILIHFPIQMKSILTELFHERCSLDKWLCSLGKWYRQASHTHFTCDFLVVFEIAVDLRTKIALHTFISIKDVCLHRTPFSHLLITRKKIPPGEKNICQNGQVKVTKIIATNIIFFTYFAVST